MKECIDFVLRKEKKPISIDKILEKITILKKSEDESFTITEDIKNEILAIVDEEVKKLDYYKTPNGFYTLLSKTSFRKGRFRGNRAGEGIVTTVTSYVNREGEQVVLEDKYSISKDLTKGAIDGDYVLIDIGGKKPKVEKVLERNIGTILGEVTRIGGQYFVQPMDKRLQGITIAVNDEVIEGERVLVSLEEERDANYYLGKIVQVFRHKDDPHADALFEAFKCGMPEGFSDESLKQLEYIPNVVNDCDKAGRYDFTDWEIFSIDGADTKDKDDCISLQILPNGNRLLGVHIADVPHYVPYGSPIHKDAFRKGTSYYFGGCVEPQLPRKLSNGICSLNDGVERLCKSILIEYDKDGHVVSRSLVPSVIKSRIGMTYDKVNQLLDGVVDPEYSPYVGTLIEMNKLANELRVNRIGNGAVEFIKPEIKFIHDEKGNAVGVTVRESGSSENMIQEFMLAGNVNVGEILTKAGIPCVYRVHGMPNVDRLAEFLRLLNVIGIPFQYSADEICRDKTLFQKLANHIQNTGHLQMVLTTNLIKCMSHASYSTNNIGHYGAGFDIYIHYTSPIRRLADDTVSRIIDECYFEKDPKKKKETLRKWFAVAPDFANQASKMERVEEDVEKNVNLMDAAVLMSSHINEEFEGTIISMGNHGLMIQLDNLLEGRVRLHNLEGDYAYNPDTFTLLAIDGGDSYYIGDRLKLKLLSADKENKTIDFSVIEKIYENPTMDKYDSNQKVKSKYRDNRRQRRV